MEIILVRHGKPEAATNPIVNFLGYVKWVKNYHHSAISKDSFPSINNIEQYKSYAVVASDLLRAIHSAKIFTAKAPMDIDKNLREMELPYYRLPLYMPAMLWLYMSRLLWVLGCKGKFESFKVSKIRAIRGALLLIKRAEKEGKVIVFGHGLINRYIRQVLIKKGWESSNQNSAYWGITRLTFE